MYSPETLSQPQYINNEVYELVKNALLWERNRGVVLLGNPKYLSVRMPEALGGQIALWANIAGNYDNNFSVIGVTVERGRGDDRYKMDFSKDCPEVYDVFTGDFIDPLANFDKHDHNICSLKYIARSGWANRFIEIAKTIDTKDATSVEFKDKLPAEMPAAFYDRQAKQKAS